MKIKVIGAGLAGSEAAYYLARHGVEVELYDIKPHSFTPAHTDKNFCELVCSNSLKSNDVYGNACGLLKEEMRRFGSLTMEAAEKTAVPAGGALAVDRAAFSEYVTQKLKENGNIKIVVKEVTSVPDDWCIVATGPLTTDALSSSISSICGGQLHFYDASAPIVSAESIDFDKCFFGGRYGKGGDDYLNCPLNEEECIICTGPLTTDALSRSISRICGGQLSFYDASAPIISRDSIDLSKCFIGDRYGKGSDDYVNCPLTEEEYKTFVAELLSAETAP